MYEEEFGICLYSLSPSTQDGGYIVKYCVYKLFRLVVPSQPSLPVSLPSLSVAIVFI